MNFDPVTVTKGDWWLPVVDHMSIQIGRKVVAKRIVTLPSMQET